ncbi:DUF4886 domain-containing protein [Mesonia sp. HuA40]|uniref:PKD domain-containing protein n=1 Tax=Mesonia sp. HuA40 TaxID=2602761 RepID=UPI0011C79B1C|nr:DUF4886 domain-containing protein [Mesonia sp. HuA40]TXK72723.1 DUF4886 domain-containing protein [Mesonia sp. HuA40]
MRYYLYIIFLLYGCLSWSQQSKSVLFIGNSYTGANNLAQLVTDMANNAGHQLNAVAFTPGGARFLNHDANAQVTNLINQQAWDAVILQGQSQETSFGMAQMQQEVYPHVASLVQKITANQNCTVPMLFMTWGRENGDAGNCPYAPWVCTYTGMDDAIYNTYMDLGQINQAQVAPVGRVWRNLRTNHPNLNLYTSDGSHPNYTGSFAAACTFFTSIFNEDPTQLAYLGNLSANDAQIIKAAVKTELYDVWSNYDFTPNLAQAIFSYNTNQLQVQFDASSSTFETLEWDFGDGNTSTQVQPQHTYATPGDYTVNLQTTYCNKTVTEQKNIKVEKLDLTAIKPLTINLIFDQLNQQLSLSGAPAKLEYSIYDLQGKTLKQGQLIPQAQIDLQHLAAGRYFLRLGNQQIFSFVKLR